MKKFLFSFLLLASLSANAQWFFGGGGGIKRNVIYVNEGDNLTNKFATLTNNTTMFIGPGTYDIIPIICGSITYIATNHMLLQGKTNIAIIGSGPGTIISGGSVPGAYMFIERCSNIFISGIHFRGSRPRQLAVNKYYAMIETRGTNNNIVFKDLILEGFGGHGISDLWGTRWASQFSIKNCVFFNGCETNIGDAYPTGVAVAGGGTGYAAGNTLTVVGGTFSTAVKLHVVTAGGGIISAVVITNSPAAYSVFPANPVSVTGGSGSGATFNLSSWGLGTADGAAISGIGNNWTIDGNYFDECFRGIEVEGSGAGSRRMFNNIIKNNTITQFGEYGIFCQDNLSGGDNMSDIIISGNIITSNKWNGITGYSPQAISLNGGRNMVVSDNIIKGLDSGARGISVTGAAKCNGLIIRNNILEDFGTTYSMIEVLQSTYNISNVTILGNILKTTTSMVDGAIYVKAYDAIIQNNQIINAGGLGIKLASCNNFLVYGNRANDTRSPRTMTWGLSIDAGCTNIWHYDNNFASTLSGTVTNLSVNGNNVGSALLSSGAATVHIGTNMISPISIISLAPSNTFDAATGHLLVSNRTAHSFIIRSTSATDSRHIFWRITQGNQ